MCDSTNNNLQSILPTADAESSNDMDSQDVPSSDHEPPILFDDTPLVPSENDQDLLDGNGNGNNNYEITDPSSGNEDDSENEESLSGDENNNSENAEILSVADEDSENSNLLSDNEDNNYGDQSSDDDDSMIIRRPISVSDVSETDEQEMPDGTFSPDVTAPSPPPLIDENNDLSEMEEEEVDLDDGTHENNIESVVGGVQRIIENAAAERDLPVSRNDFPLYHSNGGGPMRRVRPERAANAIPYPNPTPIQRVVNTIRHAGTSSQAGPSANSRDEVIPRTQPYTMTDSTRNICNCGRPNNPTRRSGLHAHSSTPAFSSTPTFDAAVPFDTPSLLASDNPNNSNAAGGFFIPQNRSDFQGLLNECRQATNSGGITPEMLIPHFQNINDVDPEHSATNSMSGAFVLPVTVAPAADGQNNESDSAMLESDENSIPVIRATVITPGLPGSESSDTIAEELLSVPLPPSRASSVSESVSSSAPAGESRVLNMPSAAPNDDPPRTRNPVYGTINRLLNANTDELRFIPGHIVVRKNINSRSISIDGIVQNGIPERLNQTFDKNLNKELLQLLECPVCFEHMTPPIHQCVEGHTICNSCIKRVRNCPICRADILNARCSSVEKMASLVRYPCKYVPCKEVIGLADKYKHERYCKFREFQCPFIHCTYDGLKSGLMGHLEIDHPDGILHQSSMQIDVSTRYYGRIERVLFVFNEFFYVSIFTTGSHITGFVCMLGADRQNSEEYLYEFTIKSRVDQFHAVKFSRLTHPFSREIFLSLETHVVKAFCHSSSFLQAFIHDNNIRFLVEIFERPQN